MLNFLNIAALAGLAGILLPVLIHFFAKKKAQPVLFGSVRFLENIRHQEVKRLRIKELLLLVIRCLAVMMIVLSFAQPALKSFSLFRVQGRKGVRSALVLDRSASVTGRGLYSAVTRKALEILDIAAEGDKIAVFWSDTLALPRRAGGASEVRRQIAASEGSYSLRGGMQAALVRAADWLNSEPGLQRELFLISDLQSSGFAVKPDTSLSLKDGTLYAVQPGEPAANVAVVDCGLEKQIIRPGKSVRLYADLMSSGSAEERQVHIRLECNKETAAGKRVTVPAGETVRVSLTLRHAAPGWNRCRFVIDHDAFSFDDTRAAAFYAPEKMRVLLLAARPDDLKPVELALRASQQEPFFFLIEKQLFIENRNIAAENFDVVIMVNYPFLTRPQAASVQSFLAGGGGLIMLPGEHTDLQKTDDHFLSPFFGIRTGQSAGQEGYLTFGRLDREHPLISPLFTHRYMPAAPPRIYRYLTYRNAAGLSVVTFSDGTPFLTEIEHERGRLLLFSTGIAHSWSDFALSTVFAPLMYQTAVYAGSAGVPEPVSVLAGEPLRQTLSGKAVPGQMRLVTPSGAAEYLLPVQSGGLQYLYYPNTTETGIYHFFLNDSLRAAAAVNPDPRESEMDFLSSAQLSALYPAIDISFIDPAETAGSVLRRKRYGKELWREMLAAGIFLLLLEMALSRIKQTTYKE